jgi:hypothetical protein
LLLLNAASCIVSLNRHGPVVGHHVELVGRGELDVPPHVREQLGQFRLLGGHPDPGGGQQAEQGLRALERGLLTAGDDLGEFEQLGHGPALGDPLRAEHHVDGEAEAGDHLLHQRGDARVDGAAQDQQLAVAQVLRAARQRPGDGLLVGVEVLVDRRADDHDHVLGGGHDRRVGRGAQPPARDDAFQHGAGPRLGERQPRVADLLDRGRVHVMDGNARAPVGQGDRQRQPHVAAAPDDHHVAPERGAAPQRH